jgi:hypothetical protein
LLYFPGCSSFSLRVFLSNFGLRVIGKAISALLAFIYYNAICTTGYLYNHGWNRSAVIAHDLLHISQFGNDLCMSEKGLYNSSSTQPSPAVKVSAISELLKVEERGE